MRQNLKTPFCVMLKSQIRFQIHSHYNVVGFDEPH